MKANVKISKMISGAMKHLFSVIAAIAMLFMASCSKDDSIAPLQNSSATESSTSIAERQAGGSEASAIINENAPTMQPGPVIGNSWRLIVAFESNGEGIDHAAMELLKRFVADHQNRIGRQILYQSDYSGKEGEVEIRFHLREISTEAQFGFVKGVKQLMRRHSTVKIFENAYRLPS